MRLRRSVAILPMNMHKSYRVQELAEKLYAELSARGIEVLMDDRKERPGVMFADMELIGIPHTIVLGDRNLDNDDIEYKYRRNGEKQLIKTGDIVEYLVKAIKANTHLRALNGCQGLFYKDSTNDCTSPPQRTAYFCPAPTYRLYLGRRPQLAFHICCR